MSVFVPFGGFSVVFACASYITISIAKLHESTSCSFVMTPSFALLLLLLESAALRLARGRRRPKEEGKEGGRD